MELWIFWAILGIIFLIFEMFNTTFFLIGMAIGAFVSSALSYYQFDLFWQIAAFALLSLIFTIYVRPLFKGFLKSSAPNDTNVDKYKGQKAKVIVKINNSENTGRIRVFDEEWFAQSLDKSVIEVGELVEIKYIESMTAYVEHINS